MKNCKICGSYAINENSYDRERGVDLDLCDPHYWQKRAKELKLQLLEAKQAIGLEPDSAGQAMAESGASGACLTAQPECLSALTLPVLGTPRKRSLT